MKIVVISDLHGKKDWEKIVEKETKTTDKFVFLGDYFDSFNLPYTEQMLNFENLLEFKRNNKSKVVLLFGNHDYHYLSVDNMTYSGFQQFHAIDIKIVIQKAINDGLIEMCFVNNDYLFCHAGLSRTWVSQNLEDIIFNDNIEEAMNTLFIENPKAFGWIRNESGYTDEYGDNKFQGPLWIRPKSLKKDAIAGFTQVVGHTSTDNIIINDDIIFTDVLDFKLQYLIINNSIKSIGEIT